MKRKMLCLRILAAAFVALTIDACAQSVPTLINYQGQIANPDGSAPPTADYTLTFKIYDAATGGTVIWGPQIFDGVGGQGHGGRVPLVAGYFNVLLGPSDTTSRLISDAFNGATRCVEIKVGNNTPISPRQQILTAPFAFRAQSAERLTVSVGGTAIDALSVTPAGNVGIGTTSPIDALSLGFGRSISFDANNSAQTTRLRWRYQGDEYAWIEREHSSGAMTFGVDGTERMRIENGNVGIGTTSPQARLHIEGGSSEILLRRGDGSLAAYLSGNPAWNGGTARMILYQAGGDDGVYLNSEGSSYFRGGRVGIGTRDPEQPLDVRGNAVISGNLGIGTSDPTAKLDVAGTVKATAFQGEGMVPAGSIMAFGGPTPPPGWFLCDGTPVSRTTYANLWAAIGAAWGAGNGATTFNLPELRGYFLRGRDGGVTRDPDRGARTANSSGGNTGDNVGSVQADEFKSHNHPGLSLPGGGAGWQSAGAGLNRNTTGVSGGSETRPKNAYVNYIIKY